jgi:arabinan endo-1,5-alpha-L-arabinosidase
MTSPKGGMRIGSVAVCLAAFFSLSMAMPLGAAPAYAHDPFIVKQGSVFFLFATGQGIPMQRSRDLLSWEQIGPVFPAAPQWTFKEVPGSNGNLWAPDVSQVRGRYFLYYSVSTFGSNRSCIGLATNTTLDPSSPDYAWIDEGKVVESVPGRDDWNAIDPNLASDAEGRYYLTFGSFWGGIKMMAVDPLTGKALDDPPRIISLARRPAVQYDPIEAPFILKKADGYYLFVSFDFCCRGVRSDYKIAVGRARQIAGPYVDRSGTPMTDGGGTIILEGYGEVHGPGHNSVLRDGENEWLIHHEYDGRRGGMAVVQVRPLSWTDDGWPVVGSPLGSP